MRLKVMTRLAGVVLGVLVAASGCATGTQSVATYEIAGGNSSGIYYQYASGLAKAANSELRSNFVVSETEGSVENLRRVADGAALAGFAQGDTAVDAARGEGRFERSLPVRAAARVYDEFVHVVVPADSELKVLSDLAGRSVSLGADGSGVQAIASRVLEAAEVDADAVTKFALGLEDSIGAMQRGEIEAFFWVGGLPTPGIERLEEAMPIRLLSIGADVVERVNEDHAGVYQLADLPVGFYGLDGRTVTMTVPNYLIVSEDASEQTIFDLVRVLFNSNTALAAEVPAASYLDRRQAIFTGPIELHPGAARYFRESRL